MKFITISISSFALAVAATAFLFAQNFTPIVPTTTLPASTGSSMSETLLLTPPPSLGGPCGTYNGMYYNGATGDQFGCINGVMSPIPARLSTGTAANTDTAGLVALVSGAATITFTGTYVTAPVCVANDTTAAALVKPSATTTGLILTGTGTDVISYHCDKRT
jgi:hypothetical protein